MKLQVNVADSFCERIDRYASDLGVSRSAFCAMLIGQGVRAYDASYSLMEDASKVIKARLEDEVVPHPTSSDKAPSRARKKPSSSSSKSKSSSSSSSSGKGSAAGPRPRSDGAAKRPKKTAPV